MSRVIVRRRSPGEVRDAIKAVLRELGEATPAQIAAVIAEKHTSPAGASSIRSYLGLNTPGVFERVGRGRYSLAESGAIGRFAPNPSVAPSLDRVTLVEGDCFEWLAGRPARSVHAVVTDPPFGLIEYSTDEQRKLREKSGGIWRIAPSYDGHQRSPLPRFTVLRPEDKERLREFFGRWARETLRVLVPGAHVFVAANPLLSHVIAYEIERAGFERRGEVIRLVMTMRGGDRPKNAHEEFAGVSVMPRSMWEPWLLFRRPIEGRVSDNLRRWGTGGLRRLSDERPFGDVIRSSPTQRAERQIAPHPSLKPQAFLRQVVRASLPLGRGIVLDPFAGSGSTLAACAAVGYEGIGIEMDPAYAKVARSAIPRLAALMAGADTPSSA